MAIWATVTHMWVTTTAAAAAAENNYCSLF